MNKKPRKPQSFEMQEFKYPVRKNTKIIDRANCTFFGRTPLSWAKLTLFYVIFYAALSSLCYICFYFWVLTLNDHEPKYKLEDSLIGTNPGLGFRPISEVTEAGSIIQFDTEKPREAQYWIDLLDAFFKPYNREFNDEHVEKFCNFKRFSSSSSSSVCMSVDTSDLETCAPLHSYGYLDGRPCVMIKLNRIYGWIPDCYNDPNDLPKAMPTDLKKYIRSLKAEERNQVWVSCDGQTSESREALINTKLKYMPRRGFPAFYYPYLNQAGYLSPIVAVQFENVKLNRMIYIECRAWAKNIIFKSSTLDRMGSVAFQLLID